MKYLCNYQTGVAVSYQPGDRVITTAGESGTVLCQVSTNDPRLAHSLYVEIKLDRNGESVTVLPTDVKPEKTL